MIDFETLLSHIKIDKLEEADVQYGVDELVHAAAEDDEDIDVSGVDDDEIQDMRSLWASELNNHGLEEQLRYLHKQGWIVELKEHLVKAATSAHSALYLEEHLKN